MPCLRPRAREVSSACSPMKLFTISAPLEFVAIDILGPLNPASQDGNKFVLVITDIFSKLTRTIPVRTITALKVAKEFVQRWICAYDPPKYLLSDNGSQFTFNFFAFVCAYLEVKNLFTAAYHPQTNGQTERFSRTILAGIR